MKTFRQLSEIIMPQVKDDLDGMDKMSFVKKHGVSKSMAKQRLATEAKEKTEYDYEGDMARGQLQSIISNAQRVHDMLEDDTNIAEWVQSKITLAEDYISTVANYMMSELDESVDLNEASSAAVRMQRALDKIKQSREASERRAQELLKPKQPVQKEEVEIQEAEALVENFETINEVSLGAKIRAYASHSGNAFAHDDMGNDKEYKHHSVKANKIIAHIEKHHGKEAVKHAERAAHSQIFGHPDHEHSGEDRLSGGLRGNKNLTKAGKVPKNTVSAMKNKIMAYVRHRDTAGPKAKLPEEVEHIEEGRQSQRHPLEGHEYHKKTDAELVHIAKDAHAAAEAMKSHNTTAENKYRDQANDSATVRHFRKTSGTPDWYKKKYGHMKEAFRPMDEPNYNNSIQARQKKADDANKPPCDGPYKKSTGVVTDKSGAKHGGMSIARNLARQALKKQSSKMSVKEGLEESRKAEIVKEIMKKGKKKENNTFQAEPELGSTVVKADN